MSIFKPKPRKTMLRIHRQGVGGSAPTPPVKTGYGALDCLRMQLKASRSESKRRRIQARIDEWEKKLGEQKTQE